MQGGGVWFVVDVGWASPFDSRPEPAAPPDHQVWVDQQTGVGVSPGVGWSADAMGVGASWDFTSLAEWVGVGLIWWMRLCLCVVLD